MEFVLWVCRTLHVLGVAIWIGGLVYQEAIVRPDSQADEGESIRQLRISGRRFLTWIWSSAIVVSLSGFAVMFLERKGDLFHIRDSWSLFLTLKEFVFVIMVIYSYGYARMLQYLERPVSNGGYDARAEVYRRKIVYYRRLSIWLGVTGLLLAAGMNISG